MLAKESIPMNNPKREKSKIFCKKILLFSLKRPRGRAL
jgi:hypothetical protein